VRCLCSVILVLSGLTVCLKSPSVFVWDAVSCISVSGSLYKSMFLSLRSESRLYSKLLMILQSPPPDVLNCCNSFCRLFLALAAHVESSGEVVFHIISSLELRVPLFNYIIEYEDECIMECCAV
jgi:hypothetical protein